MKPRILVMGAGLTGLTIAFRLVSHGFQVTLVDQDNFQSPKLGTSHMHSGKDFHPENLSAMATSPSNHLPIVIQGFQHSTWSLLGELERTTLLSAIPPAKLECAIIPSNYVSFQPIFAPSPFHSLIGLMLFKGLPLADRWNLIKKLEQYWEGDIETPQDLDSQNVQTWLTSLGQSEQACQDIWNPLCQFLLGMDSIHSSALYFKSLLMQSFLSSRQHHHIFIPPFDEETLFLAPLRKFLKSKSITFHENTRATSFQCDSESVIEVKLSDDRTLTADYYVSTFPRREFMACLPERLLAKFAYFSNLSRLEEASATIIHLKIPYTISKPRLLLSPNMFNWIALRSSPNASSPTTYVSCVATNNQQINEEHDQSILTELSNNLPPPLNEKVDESVSTPITRASHTFLGCQPDTSAFRPIQKSPLSNLFVAGPWTDTGIPASRESSIVSANLCVKAVMDVTTHN